LLFPTKYYTEGFPGTVLDAYLSGVPVLASRWESWEDLIKEGITGCTFEFNNNDDFYKALIYLLKNNDLVLEMKRNCIIEADKYSIIEATKYSVENAIKVLVDNIS
jgi:glycosyltransferase involved in cell wall biosynthesis